MYSMLYELGEFRHFTVRLQTLSDSLYKYGNTLIFQQHIVVVNSITKENEVVTGINLNNIGIYRSVPQCHAIAVSTITLVLDSK